MTQMYQVHKTGHFLILTSTVKIKWQMTIYDQSLNNILRKAKYLLVILFTISRNRSDV